MPRHSLFHRKKFFLKGIFYGFCFLLPSLVLSLGSFFLTLEAVAQRENISLNKVFDWGYWQSLFLLYLPLPFMGLFIRRPAVLWTVFGGLSFFLVADALCLTFTGGRLTQSIWTSFFITTGGELADFITSYSGTLFSLRSLIFWCTLLSLLFVGWVFHHATTEARLRIPVFTTFILLLAIALIPMLNPRNRMAFWYKNPLLSTLSSFSVFSSSSSLEILPLKAKRPTQTEGTYVMIIHESLNRHHMSLYGYPIETTPQLSALHSQFLVFDDVVSPYPATEPVLSAIFLRGPYEILNPKNKAFDFLASLHTQNIDVSWISNQAIYIDNKINRSLKRTNLYLNIDAGHGSEGLPDGILLESFAKILRQPHKKRLIVLHLRGCHFRYEDRYDEHTPVFSDDLYTRGPLNLSFVNDRHLIRLYDTCVLYTDRFLTDVIRLMDEAGQKEPLAWMMFSDHGESLFDVNENVKGHGMYGYRTVFEIPLLFGASEPWKRANPQAWEQVQKRRHDSFMTDMAGFWFLDMMGLETIEEPFAVNSPFRKKPARRRRLLGFDGERISNYDREYAPQRLLY